MKLFNYILITILVLAGLLLYRVWSQKRDLTNLNTALNKQLMQADLKIGRAHTEFGDAQKRIKELDEQVQKDIKERKGYLTRIGELEAKLDTTAHGSGVVTKDSSDIYVSYSDFRIDINNKLTPTEDGTNYISKLDYKLHLTFSGQVSETILPSGAINNYLTLWELDNKGNKVNKLEITKFNIVVDDLRAPKLWWWAPHIDVSIGVNMSSLFKDRRFTYIGSAGISTSGYGLTKNDLAWRFLRVSADMGNELYIGVTPVLYNLGDALPLISNLWIGSGISFAGKDKILTFFIGAVL